LLLVSTSAKAVPTVSAFLLKAADRRYELIDGLAGCLHDLREAGKVDHSLCEILVQRIFGIACGYPDANDSARPVVGSHSQDAARPRSADRT
jgi:hypothetical protein